MTCGAARRQGIGTAPTALPLFEARELGYRAAILHATETGLPIHERLGFREYCTVAQYIRASDTNEA